MSAGSWVLCQILAVNKDISQIDDVMTSGFCVGDSPGDVEGEGSCSEESSSIRCFNCHECKVSNHIISQILFALYGLLKEKRMLFYQ